MTAAAATGGRTHRHHLIPVYLCGKDQGTNFATINSRFHGELHGQLDRMELPIEIAGKAVTLMLSRGKAKLNLPYLQKFLKKPYGRGAMVGALHMFYEYFDFMGLRNSNSNGATFGAAFFAEAGRYVQSRRDTSLPTCRK